MKLANIKSFVFSNESFLEAQKLCLNYTQKRTICNFREKGCLEKTFPKNNQVLLNIHEKVSRFHLFKCCTWWALIFWFFQAHDRDKSMTKEVALQRKWFHSECIFIYDIVRSLFSFHCENDSKLYASRIVININLYGWRKRGGSSLSWWE